MSILRSVGEYHHNIYDRETGDIHSVIPNANWGGGDVIDEFPLKCNVRKPFVKQGGDPNSYKPLNGC